VIVNLIGATKTRSGLKVYARLVTIPKGHVPEFRSKQARGSAAIQVVKRD
jgi:hypothetical protein